MDDPGPSIKWLDQKIVNADPPIEIKYVTHQSLLRKKFRVNVKIVV